MTAKPTAMGASPNGAAVAVQTVKGDDPLASLGAPETAAPIVLTTPEEPAFDTGSIVLKPEDQERCKTMLAKMDLKKMQPGEIVLMGSTAEKELHSTLDGFLARLNKGNATKLFALFDRLDKGVKDADLDNVLKTVLETKPGWWTRLLGWFSGKDAKEVAQALYEKIVGTLSLTSKNLQAVMNGMEKELNDELQKLIVELKHLDQLKVSYTAHRENFAIAAALAKAFVNKSETLMIAERANAAQANDAVVTAKLHELESKFENLKSRALVLEGQYTRLPADQLIIQQIQDAGVQTLQEVANTASTRFASIKQTLLQLQGALQVKGVQMLSAKHDDMDRQLQDLRQKLGQDVVTTAANAAGDNRIKQAEAIKKLIEEAKSLQAIVIEARKNNETKFQQAAATFKECRDELARLGQGN